MAFEPLPAVSGEQYKYEPLVIEHYGPPIPTFDELETKGSVPHKYRSSSKCVFFMLLLISPIGGCIYAGIW